MCRRLEVPVPPAGHWAKVQHGRKVKPPPLQGHYAGTERVKLQLRSETEAAPNRREPSSRKAKFRQLEIDNSLPLRVPEKLTKPDPLIIAAKAMLATAKPDSYTFIGMISSGKETLDIRVTKGNIGRSLLFMDTLIKALRARGHQVAVKDGNTCAIVAGHEFDLALREKMRRELVDNGHWKKQEFRPSGLLALQVSGRYGREYKDGSLRLEEQIAKVIIDLEQSAVERAIRKAAEEKAEVERKERQRLQHELEQRRKVDLANFKRLLHRSERWNKAVTLRNYIQEFENRAANGLPLSDEQQEWIAWAKKKADWYDPFVEAADELLAEVDQNLLELPPNKFLYNW
ncbi:hypothetical protein GCM10023184_29170 [Flaviaesturariibacter amylovorans]|uniref:Uncharacterized protein n=2 Tax=Flaviaesturariibacter amylovorans TaxID=1084520 RepID=A0ABP8H619_9BACT